MSLLEKIKSDRAQKRAKQPYKRAIFDRVGFIVKEYGLRENFLEKIDRFSELAIREKLTFPRVRVKRHFDVPLFALSTADDYQLALAIIKRTSNQYLNYVHSPEEIVLCRSLYLRNPTLGADILLRYHFETLLLYEMAKEEVRDLSQQMKAIERKKRALSRDQETVLRSIACSVGFVDCPDGWSDELIYDRSSRLEVIQDRIGRMRRFIATVEEYAVAESGR